MSNSPYQMFTSETFSKMFPMPETMGTFAREAVDAGSESALASAKGLQDAGSALLEQLTAQVNLSVETTKKLAEAETLENAMALQAGYVKTATEASLKGFSAFSELCSGAVRDAMAPLAAQMTKATKLS
ncbi:MAG: TIGR01841 family phasin [Henriciella sp.]|jgi:phasin family protein